MKKEIITNKAPGAIGPYSQGIRVGKLLFTSGQIPINPKTGQIPEGIVKQTNRSLKNIRAILKEEGYEMDDIVKITVYLANMEDFLEMNKVYESFFTSPYPARSAVEVARLPKDVLIEIEAIARKKQEKS